MIASDFYKSPMPALADLPRIKALGINTVAAYIYVSMASRTASEVQITDKTVSDAQLTQFANAVHKLGMAVQFAPIVAVQGHGGWRGRLAPTSMSAWFRSYNTMITHYTYLAQQLRVELFSIGSELDSLQYRTYNWQQMFAWVDRHYSGLRTYMSTGVQVFTNAWWGSLDLISLSPYYSLSNNAVDVSPSISQLVYVWKHGYLPKLYTLSRQYHRSVLFAEIGYCSVLGATAHPSYAYSSAQPVSQQAQANAYIALLDGIRGASWLRGVIWWHWDTPNAAVVNREFSMRDKAAECVIAHYWSRQSLGVGVIEAREDVCLVNHAAAA